MEFPQEIRQFVKREYNLADRIKEAIGIKPFFGLPELFGAIEKAKAKGPFTDDQLSAGAVILTAALEHTGIKVTYAEEGEYAVAGLNSLIESDEARTAEWIEHLDGSIEMHKKAIASAEQGKIEARKSCDSTNGDRNDAIHAVNKVVSLAGA